MTAIAAIGLVHAALARAVQPNDGASDRDELCAAYEDADVVVLGRAQPPIVVRISGEKAIAQARQDLARVEAEVEHLRTTLDARERLEREVGFQLRISEALAEVHRRQIQYPLPIDVTFTPIVVEQALRGAPGQTFLAFVVDRAVHIELGELYVLRGHRSNGMLPFPEMTDLGITEYVNVTRVSKGGPARREADFLASTASGRAIPSRP